MKTVAHFQRDTEDDLNEWAGLLPGQEPERRAFARLFLTEVLRYLEEVGGPPAESIPEPGVRPPTYWWYTGQFWIRFCVAETKPAWRALWKERVRRVTIIQVRDALPENLAET